MIAAIRQAFPPKEPLFTLKQTSVEGVERWWRYFNIHGKQDGLEVP
jgi:hypothetical protein